MTNKFLLAFLTIVLATVLSATASYSAVNDSRFGVLVFFPWNHDWNNHMYSADKAKKAMNLVKDAGIGWVRMDFSRNYIEPDKAGQYDFTALDRLVGELNHRNINILGVLGYSPAWAAGDRQSWNSPPDDVASFANYVSETVKRYKGVVDHWEIWNEPNLPDYWQPQDDLVSYGKLLKASYNAAKSANPDCRILNGGLAIDTLDDYKKFYDKGLNRYFDIFNVHLFVGATGIVDIDEQLIKNVERIRMVMARFGDEAKPLWITEIGFPGVPDDVRKTSPEFKYKPGERQQAAMLTKTFSAVVKSGKVDKIFWAFLQDTKDHFPDGNDYLGLVRHDFSIKSSYNAYKKLIRGMAKGQTKDL